jgi:hypothetical protein
VVWCTGPILIRSWFVRFTWERPPRESDWESQSGLVELHEADVKRSKSEIVMQLDSRGVDSGSLLHIRVLPALVLLTTSLHPSTRGAED